MNAIIRVKFQPNFWKKSKGTVCIFYQNSGKYFHINLKRLINLTVRQEGVDSASLMFWFNDTRNKQRRTTVIGKFDLIDGIFNELVQPSNHEISCNFSLCINDGVIVDASREEL